MGGGLESGGLVMMEEVDADAHRKVEAKNGNRTRFEWFFTLSFSLDSLGFDF